ncbi:DUF4468 domain-containing protein [Hymenobacter caeli]
MAATAQKLVATTPPIACHVGLVKAPLYRSAADTAGRPAVLVPSQEEVVVVGKFSPRWVVAKREGFLYLVPVRALSDYDPDDAAPLPLDPQTQRIAYEGVVPVPGVSQADLYARARAWVARAYPLKDDVVQLQDQAQITVKSARIARVRTPYAGVLRSSYAGVVRHTLTIYVKDGRYKYVLTDLAHDAAGVPNMRSGGPLEQDKASLYGYVGIGSTKPWRDLKVEATREARHLVADLQEAMTLMPAKASKVPSDF